MISHDAAINILEWLHKAERDLVDARIATFSGEAGTVRAVRLDEHHGLCFTFDATASGGDPERYRRYFPVSTIRHKS